MISLLIRLIRQRSCLLILLPREGDKKETRKRGKIVKESGETEAKLHLATSRSAELTTAQLT